MKTTIKLTNYSNCTVTIEYNTLYKVTVQFQRNDSQDVIRYDEYTFLPSEVNDMELLSTVFEFEYVKVFKCIVESLGKVVSEVQKIS